MKMRTQKELIAAEKKYFDLIWYGRHMSLKARVDSGEEQVSPDIWAKAQENERRIEETYPQEDLEVNDFEWGMLSGKLSAVRWMLGEDWDMLDS